MRPEAAIGALFRPAFEVRGGRLSETVGANLDERVAGGRFRIDDRRDSAYGIGLGKVQRREERSALERQEARDRLNCARARARIAQRAFERRYGNRVERVAQNVAQSERLGGVERRVAARVGVDMPDGVDVDRAFFQQAPEREPDRFPDRFARLN